jgi:hypothetical protein
MRWTVEKPAKREPTDAEIERMMEHAQSRRELAHEKIKEVYGVPNEGVTWTPVPPEGDRSAEWTMHVDGEEVWRGFWEAGDRQLDWKETGDKRVIYRMPAWI